MKLVVLNPNLIRGSRQNNIHLALSQLKWDWREAVLRALVVGPDNVITLLMGGEL